MKPFYRPELDALRFFAFLAVFAHHLLPGNPELYFRILPAAVAEFAHNAVFMARSGVVLFFMLSSYLITSLLIREHGKKGRISVRQFYIRRILRIWPLYFVFVAFCLFVWPHLGFPSVALHHYVGLATFTENWSIVGWGWGDNPSSLLWSVAVEEQFYLIWPVLIVAMGMRAIPWISCVFIVTAWVARFAMWKSGASDTQIWFASTSHLDGIAVGALIAYYQLKWKPDAFMLIYAGLSLFYAIAFCREGGEMVIIGYPFMVIVCAFILMAVLSLDGHLPSRGLVYLGKISFGLYVFHIAVQQIVVRYCSTLLMQVAVTFIITVGLAALSYHFLEMPFLRLKEKFAVVKSRQP